MRVLVGVVALILLLIGHAATVLHGLSESTMTEGLVIGLAVLSCAAVGIGAWRLAQRSGVRFFDSGFRPGNDRQARALRS